MKYYKLIETGGQTVFVEVPKRELKKEFPVVTMPTRKEIADYIRQLNEKSPGLFSLVEYTKWVITRQ